MGLVHEFGGQIQGIDHRVFRAVQCELKRGCSVERADLKNATCFAGAYKGTQAEKFIGRGIAVGERPDVHHDPAWAGTESGQAPDRDMGCLVFSRPQSLKPDAKGCGSGRGDQRVKQQALGYVDSEQCSGAYSLQQDSFAVELKNSPVCPER